MVFAIIILALGLLAVVCPLPASPKLVIVAVCVLLAILQAATGWPFPR
jgi:hypothetical protein